MYTGIEYWYPALQIGHRVKLWIPLGLKIVENILENLSINSTKYITKFFLFLDILMHKC